MKSPHLVIDRRGHCEWCFEYVVKPGDTLPADQKRKPELEPDVKTQAKILAAKWEAMLRGLDTTEKP